MCKVKHCLSHSCKQFFSRWDKRHKYTLIHLFTAKFKCFTETDRALSYLRQLQHKTETQSFSVTGTKFRIQEKAKGNRKFGVARLPKPDVNTTKGVITNESPEWTEICSLSCPIHHFYPIPCLQVYKSQGIYQVYFPMYKWTINHHHTEATHVTHTVPASCNCYYW